MTQYSIKKEHKEQIQKQIRWEICGMRNKTQTEEMTVIQKYLRHYFLNNLIKYEELLEYFTEFYLKTEYLTACLLKGEVNDEFEKILGLPQYEQLIKKTEITICQHNPTSFKIDQPVILDIDIKNVQTLYIKIFEINTENYYYSKKITINSGMSLEGLIATY